MRIHAFLYAAWLGLSACAVVPDDAKPEAQFGLEAADKFVLRGMPQNRNGVLQGSLDVTLPTKWGDSITVGTFANMDLHDNTGRAWYPDEHAGRITEMEFAGTYAHSFGPVDMAAGVHNYNVPDGESFPNGPRSSTNELFAHFAGDVLGARPELQVRYDFDQGEGVYVRFGLGEEFQISERWKIDAQGYLGYTSRGQALWNYGIRESGFSDVLGRLAIEYALDPHATLGLHVSASSIIDSGIETWFDQIGIPTNNTWAGLFVRWAY